MANPTTNYGFVLPTSTDLVTDLPADFDVALQGVDTRLKALQPGTTLGDLFYASATANTNTRLGIGSTSQVLTVTAGVPAWATPAAAAGMTLISTTALSGTSVTLSGFSSGYTDLALYIFGVTNATDNVKMRIAPNGTTNAFSYVRNSYVVAGSSATTNGASGGYVMLNSAANKLNTGTNNVFGCVIRQYASATAMKSIQGFANYVDGSSTDAMETFSGYFESTTAITSLVITNDGGYSFSAGTALLYGV